MTTSELGGIEGGTCQHVWRATGRTISRSSSLSAIVGLSGANSNNTRPQRNTTRTQPGDTAAMRTRDPRAHAGVLLPPVLGPPPPLRRSQRRAGLARSGVLVSNGLLHGRGSAEELLRYLARDRMVLGRPELGRHRPSSGGVGGRATPLLRSRSTVGRARQTSGGSPPSCVDGLPATCRGLVCCQRGTTACTEADTSERGAEM